MNQKKTNGSNIEDSLDSNLSEDLDLSASHLVASQEFRDTSLSTDSKKSNLVDSEKKLNFSFNSSSTNRFVVCLSVYATKNNISWVVTDVTKKQLYFKRTGGNATKKGYLKNSQKVALKNFEDIVEALKNIKADFVYTYVRSGFGTKKHGPTLKAAGRIIETLKKSGFESPDYIINKTRISISHTRLKGGRRGRR